MNFKLLKELGELKNPTSKETTKLTHSIHPYPAKYIPQIPNRIITEFTNERHVILDPFCGSGTTTLEAKILGRDSFGIDLNPIGILLSRVKTYNLQEGDLQFFESFKHELISDFPKKSKNLWTPDIPNINHWFNKAAIIGLSKIVDKIRKVKSVERRRILNLTLSNIIVSVSNQESETRFAAKPKTIDESDVLKTFLRKLDFVLKKLTEVSAIGKFNSAHANIILGNTLDIESFIKPRSIDLIITSPPYLNSFDYYLYHKFRIFWISYPENLDEVFPVSEVQELEIGSRYKYSGSKASDISTFRNEMKSCFTSFNKLLKPSKMLFLVVGDSIVKGNLMKMDQYYEELLGECGFELLSKYSYSMSGASRSFISTNTVNKLYHLKESHILAFQTLNVEKDHKDKPSKYNFESSFIPSNSQEVQELPLEVPNGSNFYINNNNVTQLTHGLVKYPAKYIPQIPAWAINKYTKENDLVLDPFNGSGTTAVECLTKKRNYVGIDINPLAILASKVKTKYISKEKLEKGLLDLKKIIKELKNKEINKIDFELKEFWFDTNTLTKLYKLKSSIDKIENEDVRNLMLVSMSSIIKKVSYLDESQLKVKRDPKKILKSPPDPIELFFKRYLKDCESIIQLKESKTNSFSFISGSAFEVKTLTKHLNTKFDLIVTSPPYINAMNYPMYHRYELLLLGLISPDDYINHQTEYIGTERVYSKEYKIFTPFLSEYKEFSELNKKLKTIFQREPKRFYITKLYFDQMLDFFKGAASVLKKGKKLVLVCGTNTIKGEPINTSFELSKIAQVSGFKEILHFSYEIRKHRFKLSRHETAGKINNDIIIVLEKI